MKSDSTSNILCELLELGYLVPGQAFQIRWTFARYVRYGLITAEGKLQLIKSSSFFLPTPLPLTPSTTSNNATPSAASSIGWHETADTPLDTIPPPPPSPADTESWSVTASALPDSETALANALGLSLELDEPSAAPSTATEKSYRHMQSLPIVLPRNAKEAEHDTYEQVLNPDGVRHNGPNKIEPLYISADGSSLVSFPLSKLRKPEDREAIRVNGLRPLPFSSIASLLSPVDDLTLAGYKLAVTQPLELQQVTGEILENLRKAASTTADQLTLVINKLAEAYCCLQQLGSSQAAVMSSHMQESVDMVSSRIRQQLEGFSDLPTPSNLLDEATLEELMQHYEPQPLPGDESPAVAVEEEQDVLASGEVLPLPPVSRQDQVWTDIYCTYQKLVHSYSQLQSPETTESDAQLLQNFYNYIDGCYGGDGEAMKRDLRNYVQELEQQLQALAPCSLEECGGDRVDYFIQSVSSCNQDPERAALVQHYAAMGQMLHFVETALAQRQAVVAITPQKKKQQLDVLENCYQSVSTKHIELPESEDCLELQEVRCVWFHTSVNRVAKRALPKQAECFTIKKRVRRSEA